jgi:hypothetical protein
MFIQSQRFRNHPELASAFKKNRKKQADQGACCDK